MAGLNNQWTKPERSFFFFLALEKRNWICSNSHCIYSQTIGCVLIWLPAKCVKISCHYVLIHSVKVCVHWKFLSLLPSPFITFIMSFWSQTKKNKIWPIHIWYISFENSNWTLLTPCFQLLCFLLLSWPFCNCSFWNLVTNIYTLGAETFSWEQNSEIIAFRVQKLREKKAK